MNRGLVKPILNHPRDCRVPSNQQKFGENEMGASEKEYFNEIAMKGSL